MTKNDLIEVIAAKLNLSKAVVSLVLEETNAAIIRALKKGDAVKIAGFGTFYSMERKPRKGRNPKSGEIVEIPSRKVTRFRANKTNRVLN
jgi:nucleoid DNA-binding protein